MKPATNKAHEYKLCITENVLLTSTVTMYLDSVSLSSVPFTLNSPDVRPTKKVMSLFAGMTVYMYVVRYK